MDKRSIGSLEVSVVGLGTNNFGMRIDEATARRVLDAALDAGINFIDTSDFYGRTKSEEIIGRALGNRRDDIVLSTKFGLAFDDAHTGGAKPDYVKFAVDDSLRRLATDHLDLLILHRPDPKTPIAETLGALDELVRVGKAIEIGCSNFSLDQLIEAKDAALSGNAQFVNLQNQYSLLHRYPENGLLAECLNRGISFVPYYPLAAGLLTGKYRRDEPPPEGSRIAGMTIERQSSSLNDRNFSIIESLQVFCKQHDRTLLELAFSWLLSHSAVASVIAGATSPEQIAANTSAVCWSLTADDLAEIDLLTAID